MMTVLCLWGAWMTPFFLPLPRGNVQYFYFYVERVDDTGWYECSLKNTPQAGALTELLRETELRRCSPLGSFGGMSAPGDYFYCISFAVENPDWQAMTYLVYIGQRQGYTYGEGQFLNARTDRQFRIPDPRPLLGFLEQLPFV